MSGFIARVRTAVLSGRLAQTLMGVWLLLLVTWVVPVQFLRLPGDFGSRIVYGTAPFWVVYAAAMVTIVACLSLRIKSILRRASVAPKSELRGASEVTPLPGTFDSARADRALSRAGYRRRSAGPLSVWGVKHPLAPLGTLVLHGSFILLAVGALVAAVPGTSFVGRARIDQGEYFSGVSAKYLEVSRAGERIKWITPLSFTVVDITGGAHTLRPSERFAVRIVSDVHGSGSASAGLPWLADPFTTVSVEDVGLTPRLSIIPSGSVTPAARIAPKLSAPRGHAEQSTQTSVGPSARYRIGVRMLPANNVVPNASLLVATVATPQADGWRLTSESETLAVGVARQFGDIKLRVEDVTPNVVVRVTRSLSTPFLALGVLFLALGSVTRLVFTRTEVIFAEEDGRPVLRTKVDAIKLSSSERTRLLRAWEGEVS